jgi:coenzyme F420-reducing hydrogenase alpha subunit
MFLLHTPDFLGYDDAIQMARDFPDKVQQGLQLKKTGNEIVKVLGGREIHPINARVGGFYKLPAKHELSGLTEPLKRAREAVLDTLQWMATLPFPECERDYVFVALRHPGEYPIDRGRLVSSEGLDISVHEYDAHFVEEQVPYSNALQSTLKNAPLTHGGAYLTGPLARYNLNFDCLSPTAKDAARTAGLSEVCRNPFKSIAVRGVETVYACDEALRIIDEYELPGAPGLEVRPREATGYGCTEAPRGILYHRYSLDREGSILDAKIVPPTAQNQMSMEADLKEYVSRNLDLPHDRLTRDCEQVIRNYDPCISCATHFLKLTLDRG